MKKEMKELVNAIGGEKLFVEEVREAISIPAPRFQRIEVPVIGISPLVLNKMPHGTLEGIRRTQEAGAQAKSKKVRSQKDFEKCFRDATYRDKEGWCGVHAASIRNACISACRTAGFMMTRAKLALWVVADGSDAETHEPLIRIWGPDPEMSVMHTRNANGNIDLRARPLWNSWRLNLNMEFDADMLSKEDIVNLLCRAGRQVGIGEGRPDSKKSCGLGFGLFKIEEGE